MKNAVIFAGYFPHPHRIDIYLENLKKHFSDCDFYIGLNSSFPGTEEYLNKKGFNNIIHVPTRLEINSDASAFQAALLLFRAKNIEYDNIYFLHSKGTSYVTDVQWQGSCNDYFVGFCIRRHLVDEAIKLDGIGGVSYVGRKHPMDNGGYSIAIDELRPNPKQTHVDDIMSLITFYAIKGNIIKDFVYNCREEFFNTKMSDRYFFESSFPLVVDKAGYKRHHLVMWD
jgi:hypothetical protein